METCEECCEDFPIGELKNGMCEDCYGDFDALDLEDKLETLMGRA